MSSRKTGRRLCKAARDFKCAFGNADGTCDLLDAFSLKCRKGTGGKFSGTEISLYKEIERETTPNSKRDE